MPILFMFYSNSSAILTALFFNFLSLLLLFSLHRKMMVRKFIPCDLKQNPAYQSSFKRLYWLGLRFDCKAIALILSPFLLIGLICAFFEPHFYQFLLPCYMFFITFMGLGLLIGNYFYYKTYNNYYDIFVFGLKEDDTVAVLKNIYDDYPVIKVFVGLLSFSCLFSYLNRFLLSEPFFYLSSISSGIGIFIAILILFLLARGTIHSTPLGKNHAQVSTKNIINKFVPNGIIAMIWAFSDKKRQIKFKPVTEAEGEKLMQDLFNRKTLLTKTEENPFLAENQPHVVLSVMESFGMNFLAFDDPKQNDLLGKLRPYFDDAFVFKRFLAETVGTASTLMRLFCYSPLENISQSEAQKIALPYSAFKTYKNQGYKTIFITSGNIMWRNLGNYLPLQGVDEIYDQNSLIDYFPEAKKTLSYWGVADEYAFLLAEKLLLESDTPLFISILSITNHPPYEVPTHYQAHSLAPERLREVYGESDKERFNSLATYQYACNALGEFFDRVTQSAVKNRVILAATGDHYVRSVREDLPKELFSSNCVPFIIWVPEEIKANLSLHFDPERLGSHKDIMPTLYSISLSNAEYWHLGGRNMLSPQDNPAYAFAYTGWAWADESGVIDTSQQLKLKYRWHDNRQINPDPSQYASEAELKKLAQYEQFIQWQINYWVGEGKKLQA